MVQGARNVTMDEIVHLGVPPVRIDFDLAGRPFIPQRFIDSFRVDGTNRSLPRFVHEDRCQLRLVSAALQTK